MKDRCDADIHKPNFHRSHSFPGRNNMFDRADGTIRVGDYPLFRKGFSLKVRNLHGRQRRNPDVRIKEENPAPYMFAFQDSLFQDIKDSEFRPMFHVDMSGSGEVNHNQNGVNLQFTFSTEIDEDVTYLVLQQPKGSLQWSDITNECTLTDGSQKLSVPVRRSSKIWVIRLTRSLHNLVDALLALIHGQIWFHILVFYLKKGTKVKGRIIGISEELYQNPKKLRTEVDIAKDDKFIRAEESATKQLLKKGRLKVHLRKSENYSEKLGEFNIGRRDIGKCAERHDFVLDLDKVRDNSAVIDVIDGKGNVRWSINLSEILCSGSVQQSVQAQEHVHQQSVNTVTLQPFQSTVQRSFEDNVLQRPVNIVTLQPCHEPVQQHVQESVQQSMNNMVDQQPFQEPILPPVERPVQPRSCTKPEIKSFDEKVQKHQIPWLAKRLIKDVEKVGILLGNDVDEMDALKYNETREIGSIRILLSWLNAEQSKGNTPTWNKVRSVLEDESVRRFDIIRSLENEEEIISNEVLLWVAHNIGANFQPYAQVLKLPEYEIDNASLCCEGVEEKCRAVLQRWRQWTRKPSIKDLIEAFEHAAIERPDLVEEMRKKFCCE